MCIGSYTISAMSVEINQRAETLFRALIQRYICDGQPVGSRTLARESGLDLSPATIRNVMSDLEEMGLIHAPHTSSGRVPTQRGYRLFVDTMLTVEPIDKSANSKLEDHLTAELAGETDPQQILTKVSDLLSSLTHFAGVVLVPREEETNFKQIEFLNLSNKRVLAILVTENGGVQNCVLYVEREFSESELTEAANFFNARFAGKAVSFVRRELLQGMQSDREQMDEIMRTAIEIGSGLLKQPGDDKNKLYVSGESNLMDSPDLAEMEKLRRIFDTFKTKNDLLELLDKSSHASGVSIFIGDESGYNAFEDCSVITAPYETDDRCIGVLGVIGPTRMAYQDVIPIVDVTARLLSSALMGDGSRLN